MSAVQPTSEFQHDDVVELAPLLRRVIAARVRDSHVVEDLVQETLARVMAARRRLEPRTLALGGHGNRPLLAVDDAAERC